MNLIYSIAKIEHIKNGIIAATVSAIAFAILIVLSAYFSLSSAASYDILKEALSLLFVLPILWFGSFLYFLLLSFFKCKTVKLAIATQFVVISGLICIFLLFVVDLLINSSTLVFSGFIFTVANIVLLPGSLVVIKSAHNKPFKQDK